MNEESQTETKLTVEDSTENFSTWINRPYIPDELKQPLSSANVLIVPREGFREHPEPIFPVGTEELLNHFRDNKEKGIVPDICIADQDYKELALHDATIILGTIVVADIIADIVADLISEYIKKRWKSKEDDAKIKIQLTVVEPDGKASKLLYEGSVKDFNSTIKPTLKSLSEKAANRQKEVSR